MRRWIVTNDKRIVDDNALYGLAYRHTSDESVHFMKTDPSWTTIESQEDGDKSITFINLATKLHSSKTTSVMLSRAIALFSIQHSGSLLATLDDVKQQLAQFTSCATTARTVKLSPLTHCTVLPYLTFSRGKNIKPSKTSVSMMRTFLLILLSL
jgi:hypothetical protein